VVLEIGRYLEMTDPSKFHDDYDAVQDKKKIERDQSFQYKILKDYFSTMVENVSLLDIWKDEAVEDKLEEVKFKVGDSLLNSIFIQKYDKLFIGTIYKEFHKTEVWKKMMSLINEHGEVGLVFPVKHYGIHILHNFSRQPSDVMKEPKIIWPGNAGTDLTLQKLGVFVNEY